MKLERATQQRLEVFAALLLRWNRRINLIARASEAALWERHILNSLQLIDLLPAGVSRAIDLGSGAGLPGLVIALATGVQFDLVEADQRKAAFLREAGRVTGAPVRVQPVRAEFASLPPAPLVTARAFAQLPGLLAAAHPLLQPSSGVCLLLKGASVEAELTQARRQWQMQVERFPSRTAPDATILRISEIAPAGAPS